MNTDDKLAFGLGGGMCLFWVLTVVGTLTGYITHVVNCIQDEQWVLLAIGCLAFPVGIIHGWGVIFGWFS